MDQEMVDNMRTLYNTDYEQFYSKMGGESLRPKTMESVIEFMKSGHPIGMIMYSAQSTGIKEEMEKAIIKASQV